jgi:hypothetical protein
MVSRHSSRRHVDIVVIAPVLACAMCFAAWHVNGAERSKETFTLVDRVVAQDQGTWIVDYRLRNGSHGGVIVTPDEIRLKVEGWVSNSRVSSHALPRWSSVILTASADHTSLADVINTVDESERCRERVAMSIWGERQSRHDLSSTVTNINPPAASVPSTGLAVASCPVVSVGPGDVIHLRLRIDHQHVLYGDYDPLLGMRAVELTLGQSVIRDILPLDREQYLAQPKYTWPEPPDERRDTRHFISAPDSLHIRADMQGHQSYRFQERPVRYNTKMKLRFWYLIAVGTEGECRVRVGQNKDTPLAWRQLHEAGFEERLTTMGHWTKYERIVQTEPEATRIVLEFKIVGEIDSGEMWIDDVSLEPVGIIGPGGP